MNPEKRFAIRTPGVTILMICSLLALAAQSSEQRQCDAAKSSRAEISVPTNAASAYVVPIDWSRFKPHGRIKRKSRELTDCTKIFQNSIRYNLSWTTNAIGKLDGRVPFVGLEGLQGRKAHDFIRPVCNVAFGLAVALQTGVYDEKALGVPRAEVRSWAVRLIHGAAGEHRANGWGYPWQSALWAAYLGHGAWLLWNDLDADTRTMVAEVVKWEADRLANFTVPYWNGRGGDTKAEENAWNSMVLSVAVAMMPGHPRVRAWKEKCSEFMISAYSTEADQQNERVVDGKPVKEWLHGFNANPDGSVVNHGFLHPDYTLCVQLNLRAFVVQPLAGQPVPEAADFNAGRVYRALVTSDWPSPPYAAPGGTMYRSGEPYLYYPVKADWGRVNCLGPYVMDIHEWTLGLDRKLRHSAEDWMHLRAAKILEMQQRHTDLRVYANGECDRWPGREQSVCGRLGTAFLALWLDAQDYRVRRANWLKRK